MMYPANHRERARNALRGHWGTAILVGFVASLLGGASYDSVKLQLTQKVSVNLHELPPQLYGFLFTVVSVLAILGSAMTLVFILLGGVIQLGSARYHLNLIDGRDATFSDLFSQFSRFGSALVMNLLNSLFVFLWMLLLVIPGIIAAYSYAMAPYIMLEDPNCGGYEALRRSKQLMKGHKMDLFLLELSFIGWHILCLFTLGIGSLWLQPYISTSRASFYRDISQPHTQNNTTVEF